MGTINQAKQLASTDTPLLFFTCVLPTGDVEYWCSHQIVMAGQQYSARVLKHNLFDLQLSADDAMDGISQLSMVLANADSYMSELNASIGFKGSQLTVSFAFVNLASGSVSTESTVLFNGTAGDPEEIAEDSLTLSFTNKLNLQRLPIPDVRIQRSCPWNFPATLDQRTEASTGGTKGRFSRYYRCGYSADVAGGVGNLNAGQAYTSCDKSRGNCTDRGMFSTDNNSNTTSRFGGFEFVPTAYLVRTAGDKTSHLSAVIDNTAKYNDAVPMVYGIGWLRAPLIFSRNDGNLTHMEVLVGLGQINGILKVVVNDVEIPLAVASTDMSATGWYSLVCNGSRNGSFNLDFVDSSGNPQGDPHGSLAVLSVVVPNQISTGTSAPNVQVLVNGIQVDTYNPDGSVQVSTVSNNPVWVILDILQRCGWSPSELNIPSLAAAANYCQELISTTDLNGNPLLISRYGCNLLLTKRQSAATVIRGIRVASSLMIRYGTTGLLELLSESALASQQPTLPDGSNSTEELNGGWPAYEFSDGSGPFSGIVRTAKGASSVVLTARSIAETSNRLSVEFQDESNEYQQDSLSVVDSDDSDLIGFEVSSQSTALGITNFSQATRVLLRQLNKLISGNLYVQFQTSFRALKVRPGDIITLTYLKEGFIRQPFRVQKLSPSLNYELVTVVAQIHQDEWYGDNATLLGGAGRQPSSAVGVPLPLIGTVPHYDSNNNLEFFDFGISDTLNQQKDGSALDSISVAFTVPVQPTANSMYLPLVSLSPQYANTGGTIASGTQAYYAVSASDANGAPSPLSFTIPAIVPNSGTSTNTVTLTGLSFPTNAVTFSVYRGATPQLMYCIASNQTVTSPCSFTDTGLLQEPLGPPDANFDHANFYYRYEYAGPFPCDTFSATTIGWSNMGSVPGAYVGFVARITEGTGRGQERSILSNDATTLTVNPAWSTLPGTDSTFVIAEASWQLAAVSTYSPAKFDIPYEAGTVIEITGRAANVNNQESNADLAPLTRWTLGGGAADAGLPSIPYCTLTAPGGGELQVSAVGFQDSTNVETVTSATVQLFYWNELLTPSSYSLAQAAGTTDGTITLTLAATPSVGQIIQIDEELMSVVSVDGATYQVVRAVLGSEVAAHAAGALVLHLTNSAMVLPFSQGFFENRASSNYIHSISLPDVRISAAEIYATNSFGSGQSNQICYTPTQQELYRTLSGGQYSMQVNGYLATLQNAAPPLLVQATHAVRDIRITLGQAATGYIVQADLLESGSEYCQVILNPNDAAGADVVDGFNLPPLTEGSLLTMNVTLVPISGYTGALNPGQDLTLTIRF